MNTDTTTPSIAGLRVAFLGRLAGMPKREAQQLIRARGAVVVDQPSEGASLVVVGEHDAPLGIGPLGEEMLTPELRSAVERGDTQLITETQLWQWLGFVEGEQNVHRLYTPAMLAGLLGVDVAVIRRWHRRGLIVPVRQVRRLPYFDFQEVSTARRLAEMLASGMSPQVVERKLAELGRLLPHVERPLAQLSVIVEGKNLLLRQGDGLIEPGGQLRFDFEAGPAEEPAADASAPATAEEMQAAAAEFEDQGEIPAAIDMLRAALASGGPRPEICFQLAELLYRQGDLAAARERYFMAIELDEDFVEARANLGCVLAETGQTELAVAAFEGALSYHGDYPDVHYHLARTLDDLSRPADALQHWRAFLDLAPDSPWAEAARERVGSSVL